MVSFFQNSLLMALLEGPVLWIVLGFIIIGTMVAVATGRVRAGLIGIGIVLALALTRGLIADHFGDPADGAAQTVRWEVYGQAGTSAVHAPSQDANYAIIEGYALTGAYFLNKLIHGAFITGLIPFVLLASALMAAWQMYQRQHPAPMIKFLLLLVMLGGFGLMPTVRITSPNRALNPVYNTFQDYQQAAGTGDPSIPLGAALAWAGSTEFAESIGRHLQMGDPGYGGEIVQAAASAQLDPALLNDYLAYSDNCNTAARNLTSKDSQPTNLGALSDRANDAIKAMAAQPRYEWHALGPFAEAVFADLDYERFVLNDRDDAAVDDPVVANANANLLQNTFFIDKHASTFSQHALPFSTNLRQAPVAMVQTAPGSAIVRLATDKLDAVNPSTAGFYLTSPTVSTSPRWQSARTTGVRLARAFCALSNPSLTRFNDDGTFSTATAVVSASALPDSLREDIRGTGPIPPLELHDLQKRLRMKIAERYLGGASDALALEASQQGPDSRDFWGCLIAGKFAAYPPESKARGAQDAFDTTFRARLEAEAFPVGTVPSAQAVGFDVNALDAHRYFASLFMLASGVQRQIGLDAAVEKNIGVDNAGAPGAGERMMSWLGSNMMASMPGFLAALGSFISRIALMLYPHVLGLATLFLLLAYPFFMVVSFFPGRGMVAFEWAKAVLWVSLWPISIAFGVGLINQNGSYALADVFVNTGGEGNISGAILQIFGAMFICLAPAITAGLLGLTFGSLSSVVTQIAGSGFRFAGFAAFAPHGLGGFGPAAAAPAAGAIGGGPAAGGGGGVFNALDHGQHGGAVRPALLTSGVAASAERIGAGVARATGGTVAAIAASGNAAEIAAASSQMQQVGSMLASFAGAMSPEMGMGASYGMMAGNSAGAALHAVSASGHPEAAGAMPMMLASSAAGGSGQPAFGALPATTARIGAAGAIPAIDAERRAVAAVSTGDRYASAAASRGRGGDAPSSRADATQAAQAYGTGMEQYARADRHLAAAHAGRHAVDQHLDAGDLAAAQRIAEPTLTYAYRAVTDAQGDEVAAASASLVAGAVSTRLATTELRAQVAAPGSTPTTRLQQAAAPLARAHEVFGRRAAASAARIAGGATSTGDFQAFARDASALMEAAAYRDRVGELTGGTAEHAERARNALVGAVGAAATSDERVRGILAAAFSRGADVARRTASGTGASA